MVDQEAETLISSTAEELPRYASRQGRFYNLIHPVREYVAEYFGTLLFILFGTGAIAQTTLNKAAIGSSYLSVNIGFGLGLAVATLVMGPVSGAHFNPAITLASAMYRDFPWKSVPGYILAQFLGAFTSAAIVFMIYWPALNVYDGGNRYTRGDLATARIFATYPSNDAPNINSFLVEIVITAVFLVCIFGITDLRNKFPAYVKALGFGMSITVIALSLGFMTMFALNPARDLGPRIFTSIAGWGGAPFYAYDYYFWIPIIGPLLGGMLGGGIYTIFILPDSTSSIVT